MDRSLFIGHRLCSSSTVSIIDLAGQNINLFISQNSDLSYGKTYIISFLHKMAKCVECNKAGRGLRILDHQRCEGHSREEMIYLLCVFSRLYT